MCRKFECREDIHYKTQTGTSCEKCDSKAFQLGIEPVIYVSVFSCFLQQGKLTCRVGLIYCQGNNEENCKYR